MDANRRNKMRQLASKTNFLIRGKRGKWELLRNYEQKITIIMTASTFEEVDNFKRMLLAYKESLTKSEREG